jgi:hypothetical protein
MKGELVLKVRVGRVPVEKAVVVGESVTKCVDNFATLEGFAWCKPLQCLHNGGYLG